MKTLHALWPAVLLGSLLTACSGGTASPTGTVPDLPTGAEVRHPAAPAGSPVYLSLLTDAGESLYQTAVAAGETTTSVDPVKWQGKEVGRTVRADTLAPADASTVKLSAADTQVLLHWTLWQDSNNDGQLNDGEALPLMTHDRVAYSSAPLTLSFTTADPKMNQSWQLAQGWSRAAHYVYLPNTSDTYRRSLSSTLPQRYELHQPTPITSM